MEPSFPLVTTPQNAAVITPSDTVNFQIGGVDRTIRRIWVGVGGGIKVLLDGGDTVVYANVPAGYWYCPPVRRVFATGGTTATTMIGEY